jgi:hypothetical protein
MQLPSVVPIHDIQHIIFRHNDRQRHSRILSQVCVCHRLSLSLSISIGKHAEYIATQNRAVFIYRERGWFARYVPSIA